jgi:hypothetical protein
MRAERPRIRFCAGKARLTFPFELRTFSRDERTRVRTFARPAQ